MSITKISPSVVDFDAGITISTADNTTQLTLKSTDSDESSGPVFDMVRDSSSPADSDVLGRIRFRGDNDAGEETTMVYLQTYLHDASDGTEDGGLDLFARQGGTLNRRITINSSGEICFNEDGADIDFRVESDGDANMLVVDGGNNRVGVGISPSARLHVDGSEDYTGGIVISAGAQLHSWFLSSDLVNVHNVHSASASAAHTWQLNGTEVVRITPSGLTFNGDTAAANALDDYEEGTWTPTVIAGGSISTNKATYTKIGRTVFYYAYVSVTTPNDTSQFSLGGLPYNAQATDYYPAGSIGYVGDKNTTGTLGPIVSAGSNYVYFHRYDGNGNSVKNNGAFYNSGSSLTLIISGTYET
jgi:hypothetical protein